MSLAELIENFSLDGINKSPAIFDETKMKWLSGEYIKEMSDAEFKENALKFLEKSKAFGKYDTDKLLALVKPRIQTFGEIPEKLDFLEEFAAYDVSLFTNEKQKSSPELAKTVIPEIVNTLGALFEWNNSELFAALVNLSAALGVKKQAVLWIARVAVTGKAATAGGATEIAELIGKKETLSRLEFSLGLL